MVRAQPPATRLQPFVRYYVHTEARPTNVFLQPVPARTPQILEFTFGDPFDVRFADTPRHEAAHPIAVIGAQTYRRVSLAMYGHVETVVVVFQPGGFSGLFGIPADVLTDQHFDGRAVFGSSIDGLRERLGETISFTTRTRILDAHLLGILSRRTRQTGKDAVTVAARQLLNGRGGSRIADLAARSGLSVRQFERRFVAQIGMSPKLYRRVARFEAALKSKSRSPHLRWTDIAHALGYYDQMHMVHDFRQLGNSRPSNATLEFDLFVERDSDDSRHRLAE